VVNKDRPATHDMMHELRNSGAISNLRHECSVLAHSNDEMKVCTGALQYASGMVGEQRQPVCMQHRQGMGWGRHTPRCEQSVLAHFSTQGVWVVNKDRRDTWDSGRY
jgi:hypothetical protein